MIIGIVMASCICILWFAGVSYCVYKINQPKSQVSGEKNDFNEYGEEMEMRIESLGGSEIDSMDASMANLNRT